MNILDIRNVINSTKFNNSNVDIIKFNGQEVWTAGYWLTKTGYPLTLTNSLGKKLKDYKIYGNSIQNGTPTPDDPIEIESVGEKTKNLLNPKAQLSTLIGVYKGIDVIEYAKQNVMLSIRLKEGKSVPSGIYFGVPYKLTTSGAMGYWLIDNGVLKNTRFNLKQLGDTVTNMGIGVYPATQTNWDKIFDAFDVQLELGTIATEYEPYGYKIPIKVSGNDVEPQTYNIYLDEPLRKIGDYADYIDFENGKVVRKISSAIILKPSTYIPSKKKDVCWFSVYTRDVLLPHIVDTPVISKMFKSLQNAWWQNDEGVLSHKINTEGVYFSLKWERMGLVYDGTNVYKKEDTEKTKPLTDLEIYNLIGEYFPNTFTEDERTIHYALLTPIEQSIELPNIPTHRGTTIIEVDTTILPSNMKVVYKGKK